MKKLGIICALLLITAVAAMAQDAVGLFSDIDAVALSGEEMKAVVGGEHADVLEARSELSRIRTKVAKLETEYDSEFIKSRRTRTVGGSGNFVIGSASGSESEPLRGAGRSYLRCQDIESERAILKVREAQIKREYRGSVR